MENWPASSYQEITLSKSIKKNLLRDMNEAMSLKEEENCEIDEIEAIATL